MRRPRATSSGMSLMMRVVFPDPLHPTMPKILARFIPHRYVCATTTSLGACLTNGRRHEGDPHRADFCDRFASIVGTMGVKRPQKDADVGARSGRTQWAHAVGARSGRTQWSAAVGAS